MKLLDGYVGLHLSLSLKLFKKVQHLCIKTIIYIKFTNTTKYYNIKLIQDSRIRHVTPFLPTILLLRGLILFHVK